MLPSLHRIVLRAPTGAWGDDETMDGGQKGEDEEDKRAGAGAARPAKAARAREAADRASTTPDEVRLLFVRNQLAGLHYDAEHVCKFLKAELAKIREEGEAFGVFTDDFLWREAFAYCTGLTDKILATRKMTVNVNAVNVKKKTPNDFDALPTPSRVLPIRRVTPVADNWKTAFQRLCNGISDFKERFGRGSVRWADFHCGPDEERSWTQFELDFLHHMTNFGWGISLDMLRAVLHTRGGDGLRYVRAVNDANAFITHLEIDSLEEAATALVNASKDSLYFKPRPLANQGIGVRDSVVAVLVAKLLIEGIMLEDFVNEYTAVLTELLRRVIVEFGADVNFPLRESGNTPLEIAVKLGGELVIDLLLGYNADPNQGSPLVMAMRNLVTTAADQEPVERRILERLLEEGADVNQAEEDGTTALILAVIHERRNVVRFLLERNADPNQTDNSNRNALQYASLQMLRIVGRRQ